MSEEKKEIKPKAKELPPEEKPDLEPKKRSLDDAYRGSDPPQEKPKPVRRTATVTEVKAEVEEKKEEGLIGDGWALAAALRRILFKHDVQANPRMNYRTPVTEFLYKMSPILATMTIDRLESMLTVVLRGGFKVDEKAKAYQSLSIEQLNMIDAALPEEIGKWSDVRMRDLAFYQRALNGLTEQQCNDLLRAVEAYKG
jgi:hypothetical protein